MKRELFFCLALVCGAVLAFAEPGGADDRYVEVFSETMNAQLTRKGGVTVHVSQQEGYYSSAATPLAAAAEYLTRYAGELDLKPGLLRTNLRPAKKLLSDVGEEYRLEMEKPVIDDGTIVVFVQTYFGLPVNDGGISVDIERMTGGALIARSATLYRHPGLAVEKPSGKSMARLEKLDNKALAQALGLANSAELKGAAIKILSRGWWIYRYGAERRVFIGSCTLLPVPMPKIELPPADERIKNGKYYVTADIGFTLRTAKGERYSCNATIEPETLSILHFRMDMM